MASQYAISKARKELRRLQGELSAASAKQSDLLRQGFRGSAEEAGWRVQDLQASVDQIVAWLADNGQADKFHNWSPARMQRHQARHS